MKKYIYLLFSAILILAISLILLSKIKIYKQELLEMERSFLIEKQNNIELFERLKNHINNSFLKVENLKVVNSKLETKSLQEIISNDKLCFCFTENMCNSCVTYQLDKLRNFENEYGIENLVIFINIEEMGKLKSLNKIYQTNTPIYYIDKETLSVFSKMHPTVFVLSKTLILNSYFSIENTFTELNDIYFKQISSFFKN